MFIYIDFCRQRTLGYTHSEGRKATSGPSSHHPSGSLTAPHHCYITVTLFYNTNTFLFILMLHSYYFVIIYFVLSYLYLYVDTKRTKEHRVRLMASKCHGK